MRLATWNVAWMNALFDDDGRLREDDGPSGRHGVTRADQLAAIGIVLAVIDADAVLIVEAPDTGPRRSTVRALERLAAVAGLRTQRCVTGFASATEQELAVLHDPARLALAHDPQGPDRFDGTLRLDPGDGRAFRVRWARAPLELAVRPVSGRPFRLIGVHAKSLAPRGVQDPVRAARLAFENRRKQIAQCLWLRQRIAAHLAAGDPLIVMGDLNDGPGMTGGEPPFGRSAVEIVAGAGAAPQVRLFDPHAAAAMACPACPPATTARFWIAPEGRWLDALLDYVFVSPDLMRLRPRWRIWHPFDDPACRGNPDLRAALLAASDHFPVTIDLDL
ncbi:MAG: endonuclease/exonuclease/phosphatase family protein [Gemmobacter sp.]